MPLDEESRQRARGFWLRELSGLALLFWAVFLFMCLTSYSPADPSLNHALSRGEVQNLGGLIGAYLSGLLNDFLGSGSLVLPIGIGVMGLGFLSSRFALSWSRWLGFALAGSSVMVFFAAFDLSLGDLNSGGMLGKLVFRGSRSLLSPFGAGLLWAFIFLVGVQLLTNLPWRQVFSRLGDLFSRFIVREEDDPDFILEREGIPRATRLSPSQDADVDRAPQKRSILPARLGQGLAAKLGARLSRRGKDEEDEAGEAAPGFLDESLPEGAEPAANGQAKGKKPGRVRTAPIVNLAESDIPFASIEDCGVPLDMSYAEQYAGDVKGEAPVVVRRIRKPRIKARDRQKNGLLRLLFPGDREEGSANAPNDEGLQLLALGGEPSPGLANEVREAPQGPDALDSLDGRATAEERGALFGDDLFQLDEHGGSTGGTGTKTAGPQASSAQDPDFSLVLDDFDEAARDGRLAGTKAGKKGRGAVELAGFGARDKETERPASSARKKNNQDDERGILIGGAADILDNSRGAPANAPVNTLAGAPDDTLDDFEDGSGDSINDGIDNGIGNGFDDAARPDFGGSFDDLQLERPAATGASAVSSSRPAFAGMKDGPLQSPDPTDDFFDQDEDEDEDEDDAYVPDVRVPEIVRGASGLAKGRQERVSPADGLMYPPLELLDKPLQEEEIEDEELQEYAERLLGCLQDFGIQAELVRATPGPVVTTYMLRPAPGVSVRSFLRHTEDIARSLMAVSVFIQAPVPGTDTVGIVIPNRTRQVVNFRQIAEDKAFVESKAHLPLIVGKDTTGKPFVADLAKMPHLLVAGATGQGKSVCLNAMLTSLLVRKTPNELKLLLVDPKRVEMGIYEHESHLIHPVVKEVEDAKNALVWAVQEMDQRYTQMSRLNTKNIEGYNAKLASYQGKLPADIADLAPMSYIVIVIDELADLMLQARKDVEPCIIRLAQLARASGIHMIIATQRPSVDVVTGLIKANFPCRICFRVSARQDSMTTLGQAGAEKLLGNGDMFYNPNGGQLVRLHGPYLRDEEVQSVVDFWKKQVKPDYRVDFSSMGEEEEAAAPRGGKADLAGSDDYREVIEFCREKGHVSISLLQRRFNIGFNKAARYMDQLDKDGLVGPSPGAGKPRPVLIR